MLKLLEPIMASCIYDQFKGKVQIQNQNQVLIYSNYYQIQTNTR